VNDPAIKAKSKESASMKIRLINRPNFLTLLLTAAIAFLCAAPGFAAERRASKYIFMLIGDGMGPAQQRLPEYATGQPLAINQLPVQAETITLNALGKITDSAAGGTALATGTKTFNGAVGLDADKKPLESVAVVAQKNNRKIGILTSTAITDATPAVFYAHRESRKMHKEMVTDMAASNFDLFIGSLFMSSSPEYAKVLETAGYRIVDAPEKIEPAVKTVGIYYIAADFANIGKSSLAEALTVAIKALDNPAGFFIMCEGAKIDSGGHNNDAALTIREMIDFDAAIKVALAFQEAHPDDTLIVVTADHETGGLNLDALARDQAPRLLDQQASFLAIARGLPAELPENDRAALESHLRTMLGVTGELAAGEQRTADAAWAKYAAAKEERAVKFRDLLQAWGGIRDAQIGIAWGTRGHSDTKIITAARGVGQERFAAIRDNTEVGQTLKAIIEGK
jgi:alkaline phosphatase